MKLLDSTFLAHYARGADVVSEYLSDDDGEQFVTSTINVKEIAVGAHLVDDPTHEDILTDFGWVDIRPFSTKHAYFAGEIEAQLQDDPEFRQDQINSLMGDILIAGVATALDVPIVTRNVDDFELFTDVSVETY
jgi:predicted nucleic acid-binding protein